MATVSIPAAPQLIRDPPHTRLVERVEDGPVGEASLVDFPGARARYERDGLLDLDVVHAVAE